LQVTNLNTKEQDMSMENAILELAASIRYLADSNRRDLSASASLIAKSEQVNRFGAVQQIAKVEAAEAAEAAEANKAAEEVNAPADVQTEDAEIEQAVQKVEATAKEEKAPAAAEPEAAPVAEHPDFAKDVRPVLLAAIKTAHVGKTGVAALLAKYDATHADKLDPKHYTAVMAEANALIAA
jgi:uncharacterized membrane protein